MISFINTCKWSITQESARQLNEYFSLSEQKKHLAADKLEHLSLTLSKILVTEKALLIAKYMTDILWGGTLEKEFLKANARKVNTLSNCKVTMPLGMT